MIISWTIVLFALMYALLQGYYFYYWKKIPAAGLPSRTGIKPGVTVVVIARNEEANITACLTGLLQQDYPKDLMEILVVDDHSSDGTVQTIQRIHDPRIRILQLKDYPLFIKAPAYKKSAITLAVANARHSLIAVTDADGQHPASWLSAMADSIATHKAVFQTGPVLLDAGNRLIEQMQETEQWMLMLVTAAGIRSGLHDMANGANMIFRSDAFQQIGGYLGNEHYASGDDMFLVEKMRSHFPDQIIFLKSNDAVVTTAAKQTWNDLLRQRLRWAGKNRGLTNGMIHFIWLFVGAFHLIILLSFGLAILQWIPWWPVILIVVVKWLSDLVLLSSAAVFFKRRFNLIQFIPLQLMYMVYILHLGCSMLTGKKGDWERGDGSAPLITSR